VKRLAPVLVALLLAGCAKPLRFTAVPIARLDVPHYRTHGTFPQVASRKPRLKRVNAALLAVLRHDQRSYGRWARRRVRSIDRDIRRYHGRWRYTGVYTTAPRGDLSSASTVVVSVLVPVRALLPGGNDGDGWLSATIPVRTGKRIAVTGLFSDPREGLRALAADVQPRLKRENKCVRDHSFPGTFRPTPHHYRNFALTPNGLAVAFNLAQVASPPCGRVETVVPYDVVRPYLSGLGQELVAGVRLPQ
jgi:hypothetical protein